MNYTTLKIHLASDLQYSFEGVHSDLVYLSMQYPLTQYQVSPELGEGEQAYGELPVDT